VAYEEVGVLAERRKALRNKGTSVQSAHLFIVNDSLVVSNFSDIGIPLGDNEATLQENMIHSSVILYSLVLRNVA
jgi:hypothetical protein